MSDITAVNADDPVDALDSLEAADRDIAYLLEKWRNDTETLREGDDVDVRWERGSAAKLLMQHMAVREAAKDAIAARLRADGHTELAERVLGDRRARREALDRLDEVARQRQAIVLNNPEVDEAVIKVGELFDAERASEVGEVIPATAGTLGASGERNLASVRRVQASAQTHPSPDAPVKEPGLFSSVRALYQHLRDTPTGGTSPGVDGAREHMPGPATTSSPVNESN